MAIRPHITLTPRASQNQPWAGIRCHGRGWGPPSSDARAAPHRGPAALILWDLEVRSHTSTLN